MTNSSLPKSLKLPIEMKIRSKPYFIKLKKFCLIKLFYHESKNKFPSKTGLYRPGKLFFNLQNSNPRHNPKREKNRYSNTTYQTLVIQLAAVFVLALATTWFLRQSNEELSNFDTLLLDSLVIEDDDFADWYEENYVLNDID